MPNRPAPLHLCIHERSRILPVSGTYVGIHKTVNSVMSLNHLEIVFAGA